MRLATALGLLLVPLAGFVVLFRLDSLATANAAANGGLDLVYARLPLLLLITLAASSALFLIALLGATKQR
jgi:hypothetical protein